MDVQSNQGIKKAELEIELMRERLVELRDSFNKAMLASGYSASITLDVVRDPALNSDDFHDARIKSACWSAIGGGDSDPGMLMTVAINDGMSQAGFEFAAPYANRIISAFECDDAHGLVGKWCVVHGSTVGSQEFKYIGPVACSCAEDEQSQ